MRLVAVLHRSSERQVSGGASGDDHGVVEQVQAQHSDLLEQAAHRLLEHSQPPTQSQSREQVVG